MNDQPITGQERPARLSEDEHEQMVEVHIDWCGADQETTTERPICRYCWHEGVDGKPRHQDWPCEVVRLRSDRDAWKARAERLRAAATTFLKAEAAATKAILSQAGAGIPIEDDRFHALLDARRVALFALTDVALAEPQPPCPGYVPTGHVCERCGEAPEEHSRARGLDGEDS